MGEEKREEGRRREERSSPTMGLADRSRDNDIGLGPSGAAAEVADIGWRVGKRERNETARFGPLHFTRIIRKYSGGIKTTLQTLPGRFWTLTALPRSSLSNLIKSHPSTTLSRSALLEALDGQLRRQEGNGVEHHQARRGSYVSLRFFHCFPRFRFVATS